MSLSQQLMTDFYEFTMAAGYFLNDHNPMATFELFFRRLPDNRNYLVFAGLEQVLDYIENWHFSEEDITWLKQTPGLSAIPESFWDYLSNLRFTGSVWAMPEGQCVFPGEPVLRITAPIIEAQLLETFALSTINFQTAVASKASRIKTASMIDGKERHLMEFGARRAHGPEAGILAARAAYIAGFDGTSNVAAGKKFGIPVYGTAAHSWTLAFREEEAAFQAYYDIFGKNSILLVDTFNTMQGIEKALKVSNRIAGIRIDSGNLLEESKQARAFLDSLGLQNIRIILSGDLDEYRIRELVEQKAQVDSLGVGTRLTTVSDAPFLGGIYKLTQVEDKGEVRMVAKLSPAKQTLPGRKQVCRLKLNGKMAGDFIALEDEKVPGTPLLKAYVLNGKRVIKRETVAEIRERHLKIRQTIPDKLLSLTHKLNYEVEYGDGLKKIMK